MFSLIPVGTQVVATENIDAEGVDPGERGIITGHRDSLAYPYVIDFPNYRGAEVNRIFSDSEFEVVSRRSIYLDDLDSVLNKYFSIEPWYGRGLELEALLTEVGYTPPTPKRVRAVIEIIGDPADVLEIEEGLMDLISGHNVSYHSETKDV